MKFFKTPGYIGTNIELKVGELGYNEYDDVLSIHTSYGEVIPIIDTALKNEVLKLVEADRLLAADIAINTTGIATNITNILTNKNNIATNTTNIGTNTTNILTNKNNIDTNITNIGHNTTNIATNTTNIATNAANIVDVVSIVTNASGSVIKYANGYMTVLTKGSFTGAIGTASGAIFKTAAPKTQLFPAAFIAHPHVTASPDVGDTGSIFAAGVGAVTNTAVNITLFSSVAHAAGTYGFTITAQGLWK